MNSWPKRSVWLVVAIALSYSSIPAVAQKAVKRMMNGEYLKCDRRPNLPPDEIISYCSGLLLMGIGNTDDGRYHYPRRVAIANQALHAGLAYQRKGDSATARKYFVAIAAIDERLKAFPDNAEFWAERCWVRAVTKTDQDMGLADCAIGLKAKPGDGELLRNRGLALYRLGRSREALASYDASLQARPSDAFALFLRGSLKQKLGELGGEAEIKSAMDLDPDIAATLNNYVIN